MSKAECPTCGAQVFVGGSPRLGQRFTCAGCKTVLEIVWLDPVELDWPYDDDDDEDDRDDD
jgi:lysine biosynthesis protein LysW